jgi:hypothetical protein
MVRDATYVLDEILGNDMELPIAEHVVHTSGFTEVVLDGQGVPRRGEPA